MNKTIVRIGCLTCLAFMALSCTNKSGQEVQPSGYETMKVKKTNKSVEESYSATIRGCQDIDILPQVSGKIQRLCVSEGDIVRRGQILFVIDQVPYKAALQTAEANMEVAKADLRTAELNFNNSKTLYEKKVISHSNLMTVENSYYSAKARVAQASAQLTNARNDLSYTEVKSPCEGVVGSLPYRVGTLVSPSMPQPLTTVSDNSKMYVYFSMTENRLLQLTKEHGSMTKALSTMPDVMLRLNDGSMYESAGRIESISGVIDRSTGTVTMRAVFPNASRILHSGASGSVVIPSSYNDCIVIPQEATVKLQDKIMVYKIDNGIAKSQLIEVAPLNDGREYVVINGLKVNDEIVAKGAGLIKEGQKVR
ncbi:MAG: efflux RND transporter periplasmic adaptor subunit [Prevotella sp.]